MIWIGSFVIALAIFIALAVSRMGPRTLREGVEGPSSYILAWYSLMAFVVIALPTSLVWFTNQANQRWTGYISSWQTEVALLTNPGEGGASVPAWGIEATRIAMETENAIIYDGQVIDDGNDGGGSPEAVHADAIPGEDSREDETSAETPVKPSGPTAEELALMEWRGEQYKLLEQYRIVGDIKNGRAVAESLRASFPSDPTAEAALAGIAEAEARMSLRDTRAATFGEGQTQDVVDILGPGSYRVAVVTDHNGGFFSFVTKWDVLSTLEDVSEGWTYGDTFKVKRGHVSQILGRSDEAQGDQLTINSSQ